MTNETTETCVPADRAAYLPWLSEAPAPFLEALNRLAAVVAAQPTPPTEVALRSLARTEAERARRGHPELFTWFTEQGANWEALQPAPTVDPGTDR
jgi:hypothetical protein